MIDLGKPALHAEAVTLFADHADPARFHYLPDTPRLRRTQDDLPELTLLKYRTTEQVRAALGSGLLSMTVDLHVPETTLTRLRSRLAARTGHSPITLAPVTAESATATLALLGTSSGDAADGPFVVRPLTVGAPLLYGTMPATFMAVLSAEGAVLVEHAMRGGGLPVGVQYSIKAVGIRPALRAVVTASWQDVYHFYENRLHGGKLLLATDIGETVESLVHAEAIKVEVDDLVPAAERSEVGRRALDEVQRYVMQELFTPALGRQPPSQDAPADGLAAIGTAVKDLFGLFALTYSLRSIDRRELKTLRYELNTANAEPITLAPQATFATGFDRADTDRVVIEIEPAADPRLRFDIAAARDLGAEDIDRIEVRLDYGDRRTDVTLDPATPRSPVSVWYRPELGPQVQLGYDVHFVPASGDVDLLTRPPAATDAQVIRIDPRELYQRIHTRVVASGVPFARYPRVLVDLRYRQPTSGWTAEQTLELTAAALEAEHVVRLAAGAPLLLQRRVRYVDTAGQLVTVDWDPVRPGVLVVGDPLPDVVDVTLLGSARFGTSVARLVVELRPRADQSAVDTRVLTADEPVAGWSWAAVPGADRGYDYRVTVHTTRNEVREGRWLPGTPGRLVVGEGIAALREVSLYLVGKTPAELGLLAVKVRFAFTDTVAGLSAEDEFLVTDVGQPVRWSYPVADPARAAYTFQLSVVGADGQLRPGPVSTTSDLIAIATLPAG